MEVGGWKAFLAVGVVVLSSRGAGAEGGEGTARESQEIGRAHV